MVYFLFFSSLFIYWRLSKKQADLKTTLSGENKTSKSKKYQKAKALEKSIKGLKKFILIFSSTALCFILIEIIFELTSEIKEFETTIWEIEITENKIWDFITHFKITSGYNIIALFILISLLGVFPLLEKYKLKEKLKIYNKIISSILYFFSITTSFTFFGNKLYSDQLQRIEHLQMHKLKIINDNKLLIEQTKRYVKSSLIQELLKSPKLNIVLKKIFYLKLHYTPYIKTTKINELSDELKRLQTEFIKGENFDICTALEKARKRFKKSIELTGSGIPFSISEKNLSLKNTEERQEIMRDYIIDSDIKAEGIFSKYEEVFSKIIEWSYDHACKPVLTKILDELYDVPLIDDLLDPILHEPIQDHLVHETNKILEALYDNNSNAIKNQINLTREEFRRNFEQAFEKSEAFITYSEILDKKIAELNKVLPVNEISILEKRSESRWELARNQTYEELLKSFSNADFPYKEAELDILIFFRDWNAHLQSDIKTNNIEDEFMQFLSQNRKRTLIWMSILNKEMTRNRKQRIILNWRTKIEESFEFYQEYSISKSNKNISIIKEEIQKHDFKEYEIKKYKIWEKNSRIK